MPEHKVRKTKKNTALTEEERKLFNELIVPRMNDINNLVALYSESARDFDDNKSVCLSEMACYIKSFDVTKMGKLRSWIHVCVKNCILRRNKKKKKSSAGNESGLSVESYMESTTSSPVAPSYVSESSLFDNISDEMYDALMKLSFDELRPFLLYAQGYSLREIAKIEFQNGNLQSESVYIIRCRVKSAKSSLKKILTENGCRPKVY